ncbi:MAG TPA: hypothetical protein VGK89_03875 [Candidatus Eisenbacteria bacterium]
MTGDTAGRSIAGRIRRMSPSRWRSKWGAHAARWLMRLPDSENSDHVVA